MRIWIDSSDYQAFEFREPTFGLGHRRAGCDAGSRPRPGSARSSPRRARSPTSRPWGRRSPTSTSAWAAARRKVQLVSGLVCRGGFSLLKRFSSPSETEPVPLSELARVALEGVEQ